MQDTNQSKGCTKKFGATVNKKEVNSRKKREMKKEIKREFDPGSG